MIGVCYLMAIRLALQDPRNGNPSAALVGNTLLFLLFARMVLHDHQLAGKPWMITLFKMTYPLYLIHQNIGYVLLTRLDGLLPKYVSLALVVAAMLGLSYVLAMQIDRWITAPLKKAVVRWPSLRDRPVRLAPAAAAAASVVGDGIGGQAMQPSAETVR